MRVSIPSGTQSLAIIRAWLEGVRIHLAHDATSVLTDTELISTASVSPSPEQQFGCRHSQVGLLFHLNKRGGSQKCIEQAFDSVRKLGCMLKDYPALRPYIIGLDAAGNERTSPPRVFGQAFRHLHQSQAQQRVLLKDPDIRLGWTYHVGEDVDDLLTGLRHIDETAALLLGKDGGRLGHALALCDDPQRFYLARKNQTEPTLGAHLLDLVWAYGRLSDACKPELISWLKKRIRNLSAPCIGQNGEPHIDRCYHAMNLDCSENVAIISEPALLEKLVECEDEIDELFTKPISLTADQQWIDLVKQLQALLRRRLANRRICIEVNPTSNLIIGGFDDYKTLPYQTLIDDELAVSINTDDPGLFITSLPGEFSAMYNALTDTMSHRAAEQWLVERVGDAERSTFLSAHTPIGSDFPINQDKFNAVFAYHGTLSDE